MATEVHDVSSSLPGRRQNLKLNIKVAQQDVPDASRGNLSPAPLTVPKASSVLEVGGKYLVFENENDGGNMQRCINTISKEEMGCKVIPNNRRGQDLVRAHLLVDGSENINRIEEIFQAQSKVFFIFRRSYGDLHTHVRESRRLKETEARTLFRQIVQAVKDCHESGIVLRDLKLKKFVFSNPERTELKVETLEDTHLLEDIDNDNMSDKHRCPAYVSPEILTCKQFEYSGRSADMWSLGVLLYAMVVGRYPFHGKDHYTLFNRIRRGCYSMLPSHLSYRVKCLISALLRKDPTERLTADDVLDHPWFQSPKDFEDDLTSGGHFQSVNALVPRDKEQQEKKTVSAPDQVVPDIDLPC